MSFLPPNQQRQSTEGIIMAIKWWLLYVVVNVTFTTTDTAMSPNLLEMVFREALSRESLILVGYGLVFTFLVLAWKRGCQMVLVVITCWHLYSALLLCVFAVFQSWPREPALLFGTPLHSYRLWQWCSWSCIHCWGSTVFCWWHMLAM